jgi:hypothetical protein
MRRRISWRAVVAAVTSLASLAPAGGCSLSGLNFREDDRVDIVRPEDRQEVTLPVTIEWTVRDFDGSFAVFVDRAPPPPGRTVAWLFRNDDGCVAASGCPDAAYLRSRGIHLTEATQVVVEGVPRLAGDDVRERHRATVVLLDERGERSGESAFSVEFEVEREAP